MGFNSPWQLLIILAIVFLLFGTKRLRSLGSDLGSAIKGFKNSMSDDDVKKSTLEHTEQEKVNSNSVNAATSNSQDKQEQR